MHHVLSRVPPDLRRSVRSLLDVVGEAVSRMDGRHLLLCSTGTRRLELFERHRSWQAIRDRIVWPSGDDQDAVHRMIYALKVNGEIDAADRALDCLLRKYGVDSFIAGCTEMHFLAKRRARAGRRAVGCVDPLMLIARELAEGRL